MRAGAELAKDRVQPASIRFARTKSRSTVMWRRLLHAHHVAEGATEAA